MYDVCFIQTANFIPYCSQKNIRFDTTILLTKGTELIIFGQ